MNINPLPMRDALLTQIWQAMRNDEKIFFLSADFGSPVLDKIRSDCPSRFINVGIAEQNLINLSAGLALEGFTVFAYAIAPFITMRCFEQTRVSLALLSEVRPMNVNLIGVGAGYSYVVSGPTHQCYEDLTLMRAMPNMQVLSPADHLASAALFERCRDVIGVKYLRLDAQVLPVISTNITNNWSTGFRKIRTGTDLVMVATGYMTHTALKVADELEADGVSVSVIDFFDFANFDQPLLASALSGHRCLISLEEGFRGRGGLDAFVADFLRQQKIDVPTLNIGVEGGYRFELGTRDELHEMVGIGKEVVTRKVRDFYFEVQR